MLKALAILLVLVLPVSGASAWEGGGNQYGYGHSYGYGQRHSEQWRGSAGWYPRHRRHQRVYGWETYQRHIIIEGTRPVRPYWGQEGYRDNGWGNGWDNGYNGWGGSYGQMN